MMRHAKRAAAVGTLGAEIRPFLVPFKNELTTGILHPSCSTHFATFDCP
jgi:hypothetical protein